MNYIIGSLFEDRRCTNCNPYALFDPLMNPLLNNTQLEEQIINLGIKLMNTGIMCLKSIFNFNRYLFKYQPQFQKISEELNFYAYPIQTMQKNFQEQAISFQHALNEQMMRAQMMQQQIMQQNENKVTFVFKDIKGKIINLTLNEDVTVEELYKKYFSIAPLYGHSYDEVVFKYNGFTLKQDDKRTLKECYWYSLNPHILVYFLNDM